MASLISERFLMALIAICYPAIDRCDRVEIGSFSICENNREFAQRAAVHPSSSRDAGISDSDECRIAPSEFGAHAPVVGANDTIQEGPRKCAVGRPLHRYRDAAQSGADPCRRASFKTSTLSTCGATVEISVPRLSANQIQVSKKHCPIRDLLGRGFGLEHKSKHREVAAIGRHIEIDGDLPPGSRPTQGLGFGEHALMSLHARYPPNDSLRSAQAIGPRLHLQLVATRRQ